MHILPTPTSCQAPLHERQLEQVKPIWPYVVEASVEEAAMEKVQGSQVTLMRLLGTVILLWSCVPAIVRDEGHAGASDLSLPLL